MPRTPRKPPPPPLEVNPVYIAIAGTAIWAVFTLTLVIFARDWLHDTDREWWLTTAIAGVVIGLIGIPVSARRWRHGPPGSQSAAASE